MVFRMDIDFINWDKIIGLTRIDVRECAISQTKAVQTNEWRGGYEVNNEWINQNETDIKHFEEWVNKQNDYLNTIKEIQLNVTYEGIYNTKEDIQRIKDDISKVSGFQYSNGFILIYLFLFLYVRFLKTIIMNIFPHLKLV